MTDLISSPERPIRRLPRSITAIAVALGLTLGAAGIAVAASPSPPPAGSTVPSVAVVGADGDRIGHRLRHDGEKQGGRLGPGGPGRALHGEAVVEDGIGGYRTVVFQRGRVTAVSATALTVKSADGFTREYALTSQTRVNRGRAKAGDIKTGHQVAVRAVLVGGKATAQGIRDLALFAAKKTG